MKIINEIQIRCNGIINNCVHSNSQESFHKIEGVLFCTNCGSQFKSSVIHKVCPICKNEEFLSGDFAETLAGYIKLNEKGMLKKYYQSRFRKSAIRMNSKRMIIWLLHKDKLLSIDDKFKEDIVRRTLWKRYCD